VKNKKQKNKNFFNRSGFSLVEVMVSVSLFVVIIMSATEIFRMVINGQHIAISSQNVQESLKYFFEVTGKEIRMAVKNDGRCPGVYGEIFNKSVNSYGDTLSFQNYYGECVTYQLVLDPSNDSRRFQIIRDSNSGFVSPQKVTMSNLKFVLNSTGQPMVTIRVQARASDENRFQSNLEIQTSITSRYYK
jgi:prepilin-type N-terminal cleavage/methylation domain-containing protein